MSPEQVVVRPGCASPPTWRRSALPQAARRGRLQRRIAQLRQHQVPRELMAQLAAIRGLRPHRRERLLSTSATCVMSSAVIGRSAVRRVYASDLAHRASQVRQSNIRRCGLSSPAGSARAARNAPAEAGRSIRNSPPQLLHPCVREIPTGRRPVSVPLTAAATACRGPRTTATCSARFCITSRTYNLVSSNSSSSTNRSSSLPAASAASDAAPGPALYAASARYGRRRTPRAARRGSSRRIGG